LPVVHGEASIGLDTDTVGVIVPVRGESPFLLETLEAILAQEPAPADVVVARGDRAA
jgi:cellulose synthase/poly-beta-1,6-N-acetylglucosamine synthase-like glycosyltransferase